MLSRRAWPIALFFLLADVLCATLVGAHAGQVRILPAGATFSAPDRCPFSFQPGMPQDVFCVYNGVAVGSDGQVCGDRVMVIWARLAPEFDIDGGLDAEATDRSAVHFGFVTSPDLVMRARVDAGAENRATIIDFTFGPDQLRARLAGTAEIHLVPAGGDDVTEVLSLRIGTPVPAGETCAFTSYDGTFVGVMALAPAAPAAR
jgi:hypothetical protein